MDRSKPAPKFLNLFQIKLPAGGFASIAHRISGVLLFLSLPLLAWLFALSLRDEQGYQAAVGHLDSLPLKLLSILLLWSLCQHLLTGLRHLLLDVDIGVDRRQARLSAWLVNIGALVLTGLYLVALL